MWISVEVRLPDEYEWVLIPNYDKEHDFEPDVTIAQYRNCFHGGCCGVEFHCVEAMPYITNDQIKHWQPLPKPPKD